MAQEEKTEQGGELGGLIGLARLSTTPQAAIGRWLTPVPWAWHETRKHTDSYECKSDFSSPARVLSSCFPGCLAQVLTGRQKAGLAQPYLFRVLFKDSSLVPSSAFFLLLCRPMTELPQTGLHTWPESPLGQAGFPSPLNVFDPKDSENPSDVLMKGTVNLKSQLPAARGYCPNCSAPPPPRGFFSLIFPPPP